MATWQATNILSGAVELPKYNATGVTTEIYSVALTTGLANGDVIKGPTIPAGMYVLDVMVDSDDLDSGGSPSVAFEAGWTNTGNTTAAGFIASGNTAAQAGGIARANVAGTVGRTFTLDTTVTVTITAAAATPQAGTMRIAVTYTASP